MNVQGLLILGAGGELITLIWVLIIVGGWVANKLKENQKKEQTSEKSFSDASSPSSGRDDSMTATDLAQKRRAQLQKLSQQRQAKIQSSQPGASSTRTSSQSHGHQSNLTPAEAVRRENVKSQYDRRADALRKQAELHRQQRVRQREIARQKAEQQLNQQQSQAKRQQQAASRVQQPKQRPQPAQSTSLASMQQRTTSRPPSGKSRRSKSPLVEMPQLEPIDSESSVKRGVADAGTTTAETTKEPNKTLANLLSDQSIRNAIIWKEILDKPLAMREQDPFAI